MCYSKINEVICLSLRGKIICKYFLLFNFSKCFYVDVEDIYNGLMVDFIIEYFINNSKVVGNIVRWKMYFRKCCCLFFY